MPYGETGEPKPTVAPKGNPVVLAFATLRDAVHYGTSGSSPHLLCLRRSTNGLIGTHLIPACMDHGFTAVTGAALLATMGVFIHRHHQLRLARRQVRQPRAAVDLLRAARAVVVLSAVLVRRFYTMTLFAMFYGLDWFATVSPTVRMLGNTFGREKAALVYGWVFTAHQLGGASAAVIAGLIRVSFDDYMGAFMLSGMLCLLAAIAALFIGGGRKVPEPVMTATA